MYGSMFGSSATPDVSDGSDDEPDTLPAHRVERKGGGALRLVLIAAAVLVLLGGGYFGYRMLSGPSTPPPTTGTLTIESQPAGLAITIDGSPRGATPLKVTLPAGQHQIQFDSGGQSRVMPITITAGTQASQYIEAQASPATGKLQVTSQPPGATVLVDNEKKGVAPLLVSDLAVGRHKVELQADGATVQQQVTIEPGATSSLVVPMTSTNNGPVSGWLAVNAPVELQVFEGGQLIGSSQSDRILITAGRHDVELVNETLGYRDRQTVQVPPGRVASMKVQLPKGSLSVNAIPWADVTVDGQPAGQTPIGNLSLPIGPHEIVFRHPQFGEQRHAVTVTTKMPARVSVDLRK
jgi:hypothetical protein